MDNTPENPDVRAGAEGARRVFALISQAKGQSFIFAYFLCVDKLCGVVIPYSAIFILYQIKEEKAMEQINNIVNFINDNMSGYVLVVLLIAVGLFYSIRTRFVQVRYLGAGFKNIIKRDKGEGGKKNGISSFQALATAIAAQVGTGNIVGACGAILIGGPGAIFWMWIIAFLGMATNYAEALLAQSTKVVNSDGSISGGPVYYIKKAFSGKLGKALSAFFAVSLIIAVGFIGPMVQSNSITSSISEVFNSFGADISGYVWIIGVVIALLAGFIFIGGIKRISSVAEKMVPIMALLYLAGGIVVLCVNIQTLPAAIGSIFKFAFLPQAIIGGGFGSAIVKAIQKGAQRGLFSNEAGMGTTPHAHAQADVKDPHEQGVAAMIGVFIDTFVVLTMTALIVLTTLYTGDGPLSIISGDVVDATGISFVDMASKLGLSDGNMVQRAFQMTFTTIFGGNEAVGNAVGGIFVAVCLFFFAFSTILSWNFFGKINFNYLFGKKATIVYSVIAIACIFAGSIFQNSFVWGLSDLFNNLMVIPNVLALFALSGIVISLTKLPRKKNIKSSEEDK